VCAVHFPLLVSIRSEQLFPVQCLFSINFCQPRLISRCWFWVATGLVQQSPPILASHLRFPRTACLLVFVPRCSTCFSCAWPILVPDLVSLARVLACAQVRFWVLPACPRHRLDSISRSQRLRLSDPTHFHEQNTQPWFPLGSLAAPIRFCSRRWSLCLPPGLALHFSFFAQQLGAPGQLQFLSPIKFFAHDLISREAPSTRACGRLSQDSFSSIPLPSVLWFRAPVKMVKEEFFSCFCCLSWSRSYSWAASSKAWVFFFLAVHPWWILSRERKLFDEICMRQWVALLVWFWFRSFTHGFACIN
jgi:hypothetical protein